MTELLDSFAAALAHHKAGRADEAEALYQQTLERNPAHADALCNLGALMGGLGELDEAARFYARALELRPEDAEVHSNLGNVMMARGRTAEAERCYRRAIDHDPRLAAAHANLGNVCFQAGRVEEALARYRRAIELEPALAAAHSNLAAILRAEGQIEDARRHLEEAVRLAPDSAEALANLGIVLSELGQHGAALDYLRRAIDLKPDWARAHFNLGVALSKADQPEPALEAYAEALALEPGYAEALRNRGALLLQSGHKEEAERWLDAGLEIAPDDAEALFHLGNLHQGRGQPERARACLERAIELNDEIPEIHNNLGNCLRDLNRPDEAIAAAKRALELKPDFSQGFNTLGNALMAKGAYQAAAEAYQRAYELDPGFAVAVTNLGNAQRSLGAMDEAMRWFETSLGLDPELANTHNSIALVHQAANRHGAAVAALERALELKPEYPEALNNLAISLQEVGRYGEAIQRYRDALTADPAIAQVYFNLASLLQTLGRFDESVGIFLQALKVQPGYGAVYSFLAHSLMQQCSWRNLDAVIAKTISQIEHEIESGETVSASAFALLSMPVPNELRLRAVRQIADRYTARVAPLKTPDGFTYAPPRNGKLRIGYVSPDFRFHSVAVAFKGLLEQHDRSRFELFGYSLAAGSGGPTGMDGLTEAFRRDFDTFVELAGLPLDEAARRINDDGINILIDLAGHTRGMRLEIFALEPAPVQAHYLGFSTTIGADYIHYLITDRVHAPPESEKYYHEKLALLPETFMATTHSAVAEETPSRGGCGLPEGAFVFGNFNSHYKFDPWLFTIWMRLLRRVPGSVMWFVAGTPTSRDNLRREAEARGIAAERLIFAEKAVHGVHLARHRHVDLALDNRYHGGGVTTVDALWVGVPVLTLAGDTPQSRNGATLLSAIGLEQLVTESLDDYERLGLALALEPERLAALKARLAANRLTEPLFDIPRLTRHLETAYRMMWDNYAAGNSPRTFEVPALPKRSHG